MSNGHMDGFFSSSRRNFPCVYANVDETARELCCQNLWLLLSNGHGVSHSPDSRIHTLLTQFKCDQLRIRKDRAPVQEGSE